VERGKGEGKREEGGKEGRGGRKRERVDLSKDLVK